MNGIWRTAAGLLLGLAAMTTTATAADETVDTSLATEVENYLATASPAEGDPNTFRWFWKTGPRAETADGSFQVKLGGRIMLDMAWGESDDLPASAEDDRIFFRRVRIAISGHAYTNVIYKLQFDFADDEPEFRDMYMGLKKLGFLGTMKVGKHFEPFSLQQLTSSKYIKLIERSVPTSAFAPSRNTGISFANTALEKKLTWQIGIFRTSGDRGESTGDGGYSLTLRITGLPVHDKEEGLLVHVGFGFSFRGDDLVRFRGRPGVGFGDREVDTNNIAADDTTLINFEVLVIWKSFTFSAEFFMADVGLPSGGGSDPSFTGFYVQFGYWITGEATAYKGNAPTRTKPNANFHDGGNGRGAIEVVFRFDTIDLTDGGITGGEQETFTIGVNWHWNPNTRMMVNYVVADIDPGGFEITFVVVRWQWDF